MTVAVSDRDAVVSEDGRYRYLLTRRLVPTLETRLGSMVVFVMLNPSTADADQDDPTLRRCLGFAAALGAEHLTVVNLYAYRTPFPSALADAHLDDVDIVGPDADRWLLSRLSADSTVIAAWGAPPPRVPAAFHADRVSAVRELLDPVPLHALDVTADGCPRHPLYLKASARPSPWPHRHRWCVAGEPRPGLFEHARCPCGLAVTSLQAWAEVDPSAFEQAVDPMDRQTEPID